MDALDILINYWPLIGGGATVLAGFGLWQLNTHFAPRKGHEDHEERITTLETGHITLKNQVENLPSVKSMHRQEIRIEAISGQIGSILAQLKGQEAALTRISNTLERHTESAWGKK